MAQTVASLVDIVVNVTPAGIVTSVGILLLTMLVADPLPSVPKSFNPQQ